MNDLIQILIILAQAYQSPIGSCDPVDGQRIEFSRHDRHQVRRMVRRTGRDLGAAPIFLAYLDAVTVRESSGASSRRHDGGTGLGPHGLNPRSHGDKWPGRDEDPAFCRPRVSTLIVHAIAHRAVEKYGAENAWDIQAVFAGRFECVGNGTARPCTGEQQDRTTSAICSRMASRGFSCYAPITARELGPKVPLSQRRAWVTTRRHQ
jgi:hypothetical protein